MNDGISRSGTLIIDTPSKEVYVVRFARPDLRAQLCDDPDIIGCELFQELEAQVLGRLAAGDTLVLNLGLANRSHGPLSLSAQGPGRHESAQRPAGAVPAQC